LAAQRVGEHYEAGKQYAQEQYQAAKDSIPSAEALKAQASLKHEAASEALRHATAEASIKARYQAEEAAEALKHKKNEAAHTIHEKVENVKEALHVH